jgi:methylmalonyl-CoA mutase
MIDESLNVAEEFPPVSYDQWKKQAEAELKGAPFEKKLVGQTYEGIPIQPLYTSKDWPGTTDASGFPGFIPLTRGSRILGQAVTGWDVRQEHNHPDAVEANKAILEDLQKGVTSIHLRFDAAACNGLDADSRDAVELAGQDGVMSYSLGSLGRLLDGMKLDIAPVSIDVGGAFLPGAALLTAYLQKQGVDLRTVRVAFNADPIGSLMREGSLPVPLDESLRQMADLATWTGPHLPHATAVEVGSGAYHHAGATSTQDLAFSVATAVEYLRAMTAAGLSVDDSVRQIVFGMSLGTQFFRAIAKVRALRKIWAKVVEDCGGSAVAARSVQIRTRTSRRVLTSVDPWVNLLRNTVCCFAGAVGGADAITTAPLDAAIGLSDEFSRKLARNTQIILQEESHLNRVIDPAGGSWFLETLTDQLAEKAWDVFRQVEAEGGMAAACTSGWVKAQIDAVESKRQKDFATRKNVVTGVSEHPDVREEKVTRVKPDLKALRHAAAERLVAWRRDHKCQKQIDALAATAADPLRRAGDLTGAAVVAAAAGATNGQLTAVLTKAAGGLGAKIEPLGIHTYAAAYEELRAASDTFALRTGSRPRVFLANLGTPAESIARATFAQNFFQAGGFEEVATDNLHDADAAAKACFASRAKIAVICSTDAKYEEMIETVTPKLKAAGARTVVLAGNPGANEAKYRSAGVDRFIYIRCDVLGTLRDLLREEGVLP